MDGWAGTLRKGELLYMPGVMRLQVMSKPLERNSQLTMSFPLPRKCCTTYATPVSSLVLGSMRSHFRKLRGENLVNRCHAMVFGSKMQRTNLDGLIIAVRAEVVDEDAIPKVH